MSFGTKVFSGVQEALVLALMLVTGRAIALSSFFFVTVFALFYVNMDIMYKVGIGVIVFAVIFLITIATQILRQQKEVKQATAA